MQGIDRDIDLIVIGEFQAQELAFITTDLQNRGPAVDANAIVEVDDMVARIEVSIVKEARPGGRATSLHTPTPCAPDLASIHAHELGRRQNKAAREGANADKEPRCVCGVS